MLVVICLGGALAVGVVTTVVLRVTHRDPAWTAMRVELDALVAAGAIGALGALGSKGTLPHSIRPSSVELVSGREPLGRGRVGVVRLAVFDNVLAKHLAAVKTVAVASQDNADCPPAEASADDADRKSAESDLCREALTMAQLDHVGVAAIIGLVRTSASPAQLVMTYYEHGTLLQLLQCVQAPASLAAR